MRKIKVGESEISVVTVNAADYISLLKVTYQAVKAVDPTVTVVMGGLAGRCDDYFASLCKNGKDWFDAVAFHPYNWGYAPDYRPSQTIWEKITGKSSSKCPGANGMLDEYLAAMNANGCGGKKVWVTEFGYPTHSGGNTEANQSSYIQTFLTYAESKGVERAYLYEFRAPETSSDDPEMHFGIVHKDLTPKRAGVYGPREEALRQQLDESLRELCLSLRRGPLGRHVVQ